MEVKKEITVKFILLIGFIVVSSIFFTNILGKKEKEVMPESLSFKTEMTILELGKINDLPNSVLAKGFQLKNKEDLQKKLSDFDNLEEKISLVKKEAALYAEEESKSWVKIATKFLLWITFLSVTFKLIRKGKITVKNRKILYLISLTLFGVVLGSDPGPMGTVKDAIALFASKGIIFPPRMIAMGVFLLMVFFANKFICSWGCQVGTLQDLIFRLNHKKNKRILRQYKVPFAVSNTLRIIFFIIFTLIAFIWAVDIIEYIDPFKIFAPMKLGITGIIFVGIILISSLFIYRPWCHFFCPFGLVGWFIEKISFFKIQVDHKKCVSCEACSKACPSTAMEAILKQKKTIPDCFSCGSCIEVCPTKAIKFKKSIHPIDK